jgi:hypothetical protein
MIIEQYTTEKIRMHNILRFFDKRFGAKVSFYGCLRPLWWLSDTPHDPKVVSSPWFYLLLISKVFLIKVFRRRVPLIGCHWWCKYMWIKSLRDQGIEAAYISLMWCQRWCKGMWMKKRRFEGSILKSISWLPLER